MASDTTRLGGNRRVSTGFRNGGVPDANIQVECQGTTVGDARLTQVGSKEDRRFVSPLQSQPELAVLVGLSVDGGPVNVLIDSGGGYKMLGKRDYLCLLWEMLNGDFKNICKV